MQWYKRWEQIRERFAAMPQAERPSWWATWDTLGVTPWDHHDSGGIYHAQGTLFDLACMEDPTHLPHLLSQAVAPEDATTRQARINRAAYEAWHRGDATVFDHLRPHLPAWGRWMTELTAGGGEAVHTNTSVLWLNERGHPERRPVEQLSEEAVLLVLTAGNAATQAWPLWAERYADRSASRDALEHLWLDSTGRVLETMCLKVNDARWTQWALAETQTPDRFSQAGARPLIEQMVARITVTALPSINHRGTGQPAPDAWFDAQLDKLVALSQAWGVPSPEAWSEKVPAGRSETVPIAAALPIWKASGHPKLAAMVTLLETHWLTAAFDETTDIVPGTARPRPRL